ncbi:hypothetical protein TWF481_005629 [Arthrobotrys musiformis]|uniref:Uncharacterized protein n=1 Tax=Arthrobotrys musiformis TaxID=47236 RepID=A0AAV9WE88_9PEZI
MGCEFFLNFFYFFAASKSVYAVQENLQNAMKPLIRCRWESVFDDGIEKKRVYDIHEIQDSVSLSFFLTDVDLFLEKKRKKRKEGRLVPRDRLKDVWRESPFDK